MSEHVTSQIIGNGLKTLPAGSFSAQLLFKEDHQVCKICISYKFSVRSKRSVVLWVVPGKLNQL